MKKNLLLLILPLLLLSFFAKAQCNNPPCPCVDSTIIDTYHVCQNDAFSPVCACDGHTYRSSCAAHYRGGIVDVQSLPTGICGNFFFDFVPNPILPGSGDPNYNPYGTLSIYTNPAPVKVLIQVYDVWGRVWYVDQETIGDPQSIYTAQPIYMDAFPQGIYYLFVTINGETQKKKIMKANLR